jgi:hypothetical protein
MCTIGRAVDTRHAESLWAALGLQDGEDKPLALGKTAGHTDIALQSVR